MIYLDNAASTQVVEEVLHEMLPFFKEQYGNPSSIHKYGRNAAAAIHKARKYIADLINAEPDEILLTSGGTESNNTAIFGISKKATKRHLITTSIEHDAVLEPCKELQKNGFKVTYLPVDKTGLVEPEEVQKKISNETFLVSIMLANNEVGTVQNLKEICKIAHAHGIPVHTDAVQAVGKIPVNVKELEVDLLSISSHKINGPKGIGALYVKKGTELYPLIVGGGQELGLRSGTENVPNIVGFGKACKLSKENFEQNFSHYHKLSTKLKTRVLHEISHVNFNGHSERRLPTNTHFTFLGINGEDLIIKLDENGIAASTGSACSVKRQKESHVLRAMGFSHEQINGSLRLTVGNTNTEQEIDEVVEALKKIVKELREISPYKEKYNF